MSRIDYARLVRKGERPIALAHGPEGGLSVRTALPNSDTACVGGFVGYGIEFDRFGLRLRAGSCGSGLQSETLEGDVLAHDVELGLHHAWDVWPALTLEATLGPGLSLFHQSFETRGSAPARSALAPFVALGLGVQVDLSHGFYSGLGAAAQTHFLRLVEPGEQSGTLTVGFALRTTLALGKQF
jgi:hypothetical protein